MLEEFKCMGQSNDGGNFVPDIRRGIGEASIDDGYLWTVDIGVDELWSMDEGGFGGGE